MIKTIIFDVAGVLLTLEDDEFVEKISKEYKIDKEKVKKSYDEHCTPAEVNIFNKYEMYERMCSDLKIISPSNLFEIHKSCKRPIGTDKILPKLKYRLGVASNEAEDFSKWQLNNFDFFKHFDFFFYSYEAKARKTELKFFETLIEKHKLTPQECLFIDDKEKYVENAKKLGFNGIVFQTPEQLKEELKKNIKF